jgi:hypothetical protein
LTLPQLRPLEPPLSHIPYHVCLLYNFFLYGLQQSILFFSQKGRRLLIENTLSPFKEEAEIRKENGREGEKKSFDEMGYDGDYPSGRILSDMEWSLIEGKKNPKLICQRKPSQYTVSFSTKFCTPLPDASSGKGIPTNIDFRNRIQNFEMRVL